VPDFYQGTELWDLSLVDPDNRRPVDFAARVAALEALTARGGGTELAALAGELLREWTDGRIKLHVTHRALACRREAAALFRDGTYLPLETTGRHAAHVCAFARHAGERAVVVVVPRLVARLTDGGARPPLGEATWGDTRVRLPAELAAGDYADVLTGLPAKAVAEREGAGAAFEVGALLDVLPVALIERRTP
jgi:(1->4)-alpha-D-glucan 1-alpha-D-glucosylmutase